MRRWQTFFYYQIFDSAPSLPHSPPLPRLSPAPIASPPPLSQCEGRVGMSPQTHTACDGTLEMLTDRRQAPDGEAAPLRRRSHARAAVRMLPDQDGPFTLVAQFTCAEFTDRIDSPPAARTR